MSILHTINKSPFQDATVSSCLTVCSDQDSVIFIEDGVLGALQASPLATKINTMFAGGTQFYALEVDVLARGIKDKLIPEIRLVNYQDFVKLSVEAKQIQSWY